MARSTRQLIWSGLAFSLVALLPVSPASADQPWPASVSASYKVVVAGFDLGKFNFTSTMNGSFYTLTGNADLTWGFGMFSWSSKTRSSGSVAGDRVTPAGYTFDYSSNTKAGSAKIGFMGGDVSAVSIVPPSPPVPGVQPLRDQHLKTVLDPLSAVIAMSRGNAANPCGHRVAVFDGKQRFDLALTFRRQEKVTETTPSGQPGIAYVCRVQYIPVAGHKLGKDTQDLASNAGIEIFLRPIPSASLLVPHRIVMPTAIGTVEIMLQRVDIIAPGNKQITLTH